MRLDLVLPVGGAERWSDFPWQIIGLLSGLTGHYTEAKGASVRAGSFCLPFLPFKYSTGLPGYSDTGSSDTLDTVRGLAIPNTLINKTDLLTVTKVT